MICERCKIEVGDFPKDSKAPFRVFGHGDYVRTKSRLLGDERFAALSRLLCYWGGPGDTFAWIWNGKNAERGAFVQAIGGGVVLPVLLDEIEIFERAYNPVVTPCRKSIHFDLLPETMSRVLGVTLNKGVSWAGGSDSGVASVNR